MLQGMTVASPPAALMPSATSWQASALREETTTLAPSFASSSAEERPMPRLEPVTTATLPVRSNGVFFIGVGLRCIHLSVSSPGLTGRSSIPETARLESRGCGVLDPPPARGMTATFRLNQPATVRHAALVVVGVTERVLDHGQALEVVADLRLHGHADAAVELDRLLSDELQRLADLHLGRGDGVAALLGVLEISSHGREHRHRSRLLGGDEHVGGAVLEALERTDRDTELLARLDVLDCCLQRLVHQADRFGAERDAGFVDHTLDQRERIVGIAEHGIGTDLDAGEGDVGGVQTVLGRVRFLGDALGVGPHQEHADAALVAALAPGARGHDQSICVLAVEHDELLAVDDPTLALLLRRRGDVEEIVARVLLELGKGERLAAVDDAGHMRGLLRIAARMAQEAAADHDGCEIRLEHQRLAERFHHDHGLDAAAAEAAIGLREGQTEQALLGELAPDRFAPAALLLHVLLAALEIVGIGQEAVDAFLEKPLLLVQIKIHILRSPVSMSSCPVLCRASTFFRGARRGWPGQARP